MGITADIYKSRGRSFSNGGISATVDKVTVVNADGPFKPTDDAPAVLIVPGNLPGTVKAVVAVLDDSGDWVPADPDGKVGPMFGGTYIDTTDARLGRLVATFTGGSPYGVGPVALHDRFETQAEYDALSR